MTEPAHHCRRFFVTGQVQGVFFRGSTAREATRLGLVGWARNLADGRVEVLAAGTRDAVDQLARWLEVGPPAASVRSVSIAPADSAEFRNLKDFRTG